MVPLTFVPTVVVPFSKIASGTVPLTIVPFNSKMCGRVTGFGLFEII